jgi:hypothetical protein
MANIKIELKWALIFIAAILLWMVLERVSGLHDTYIDMHVIFTNFFAVPAIIIYVLALLDKRNNFYRGKMSYTQGFVSGLIITIIVVVLSPLSQYITHTFITPQYFPNIIEYAVQQGQMLRDAAEEYFNMQSYIVQSLIGAALMGLVTSAIVAFFLKKK